MKIYIRVLLTVPLTLLSLSSFVNHASPPPTGKKIALIVAISAYHRDSGWDQLDSFNDVPLIKGALKGFTDIKVIQDKKADRAGILAALDTLALKADTGDMIVIHFSTHGQQITDDNNDEFDGYDETIVAYGAPVDEFIYQKYNKPKKGYDGSKHLRDDDIGKAIGKIRERIGKQGHVLVIMDSCCSGTGTKGGGRKRGGEQPFDLLGKPPLIKKQKRTETGFGLYADRKEDPNLGKFVLISAARANEANKQIEDGVNQVGSLSFCVSKALLTLPTGNSYRSLFSRIQAEMAEKVPYQTPQIEGDVDLEVFGGNFIGQETFLTIDSVPDDRKQLKVLEGKLHGVTPGTTVVVKGNTASNKEDGKTLAKGIVKQANYMDATIELDTILSSYNKFDFRVFVVSPGIPERKVKVNISGISHAALKKALTTSISGLRMVTISNDTTELVLRDQVSRRSVLSVEVLNNGVSLFQQSIKAPTIEALAKECTSKVKTFAQGQMFKELDLNDKDYAVRITRFIPVKSGLTKKEWDINITDTVDNYKSFLDSGNVLKIPEGTWVYLELKNQSTNTVYFNIIDLMPEGRINAILPMDNNGEFTPPEDQLVLLPREKKILTSDGQCILIQTASANEIFKLISARTPFNLAPTIRRQRSVTAKGIGNPFQTLLGSSYAESFSRSGDSGTKGMSSFEFTFEIVKKK